MRLRPRPARVVVGAVLLPLVFGLLVLWSLGDRAESVDRVPAAVVNLDEPVTTGRGKDQQVVAAGRLLAAGLTSPGRRPRGNLGWEVTNADDARRGLRDGSYYAVITIPENFSRSLASTTGGEPRPAELTVRGNDAASALVAEAGRQVAEVAANRLGHRVTKTFLQGVFSRTDELRLRLVKASDAAGKVAAGAGQVAAGARRLDDGAGRLAGGLDGLSSGAAELGSGADRLAAGTRRLGEGLDRLASGAGRLDAGTHRLAEGLAQLDRRTDPLPRQTDRLADGADRVADGAGAYADVVTAWKDACLRDPVVAAAEPKLCAGTVRASGARGENADRLRSGSRQVAAGARRLAEATPRLTSGLHDAAGGAARLGEGTGKLPVGARDASRAAGRLAAGADRLAAGADRLAGGADTARSGAARLAAGSFELDAGSAKLGSGSRRLAGGLAKGADQIPAADRSAAGVLADPVATRAATLNRHRDGSTLLAPAVLAFGLWLGAFVTYLVRRGLPAADWRSARASWRLAAAGWVPAVVMGVVQAALLLLGALALGARFAAPLGVGAFLLLTVAAFAAVTQAFVAVLDARRGWIATIAFTALQAVTLGGLVPIDTAPGALRALHAVLPVPQAAEGLTHLTLGGRLGSPWADAAVVALWGAAALAVTTWAARRRQRLTLDDVRREVRPERVRG